MISIKPYTVLFFSFFFLIFEFRGMPQQSPAKDPGVVGTEADTVIQKHIPAVQNLMLPDSLKISLETLLRYYKNDEFWRYDQGHLREAIGNLVHYLKSPPIDSTVAFLKNYPFPSLADTSVYTMPADTVTNKSIHLPDTGITPPPDSLTKRALFGVDTTRSYLTDTLLNTLPDSVLKYLMHHGKIRHFTGTGDTTSFLKSDTLSLKTRESPWLVVLYRGDSIRIPVTDVDYLIASDSIHHAVNLLLQKVEADSSHVCLTNLTNDSVCIWLKNKSAEYSRFWLKNEYHDSIGLWIQNISKNNMRLTLDNNVFFRRLNKYQKRETFLIPSEKHASTELQKVRPVVIKVNPWKFGGIGSVNLSQGMLSNWVKGGESSISTLWELNMFVNYKKKNHQWNNVFRFKYGLLKSGEKGIRKNEDAWDLDSRYGLKASNHWYYSAAVNLKSQIANGYKYPNDSVVVSKFMAPGYLYLSLGMDYRPKKKISVLISPLTWKSTMVYDTAMIDQTRYGLKPYQRTRNDMGAYIRTFYQYDFTRDMSLVSRLNFFSQYTRKPQNIDVDWELTYRMKLGPFFNINVSTHLIYDDDIKIPVYDNEGNKIGAGPRLQFKEWLNIGFMYKF